ncbi:MAG: sodium:solute symporter [Flavobacteriales bacterium]|nr:sodium:solute symporter [Flavobacteriales bacterium]MDG1933565.1 sodium:solute symporter [Flavobacteriales bacterium]|tara:strand:+ start:624 stop:2045 length:1422 start_codon:yes stop_codon:yes gene_type:complete
MSSILLVSVIVAYFILLFIISYLTGKNDSNETFFLGNRNSPWYIIAYGMIGTTLSGITFISVPGWVEASQFSYLQMVFGFFVGYIVVARVLLPLYYRLELTSIYTYLRDRFGYYSYKTGSSFFLLSRTIGASFRLFLIASVLQFAVFDSWNIPFYITVIITISLIWLYTYRSGMKTIIWTDTLQTTFMLATVFIISYTLIDRLNIEFSGVFDLINKSDYSKVFFFDDWSDKKYFFKQFFSGVFMAIVMTGLDQDQMQKNLSCKNIKDAQKNMLVFSSILIFVDLIFLCLGALLYIYSDTFSLLIPNNADMLFPSIALNSGLPSYVGILFIVGIIAAAYSSADSALTSLTTSFCVDILEFEKQEPRQQVKTRKNIHLLMSIILLCVILFFNMINDQSVIKSLFTVAGYTYGPLLGMYAFGLFTKIEVNDKWVPLVAILSPLFCFVIQLYFSFGFELLILNGLITFVGLLIISKK